MTYNLFEMIINVYNVISYFYIIQIILISDVFNVSILFQMNTFSFL
jgi:hypothetical protein